MRPDILSGLILVQTVCKGYQQTTKVATSGGKRVKAGGKILGVLKPYMEHWLQLKGLRVGPCILLDKKADS